MICSGFLRLWSYSYQLLQVTELYKDEDVDGSDRFKLSDRIKGILRWRMNVRSVEIAERLFTVSDSMKSKLERQALENVKLRESVNTIKNSFDTAFGF